MLTRLNSTSAAGREFAERINPSKFGFSPKMVAIVGAIIDFDYGVTDKKGGRMTALSITSDGFVTASSTSQSNGVFIGEIDGLTFNINVWKDSLKPADRRRFDTAFKENVIDWR